MKKIVLVTACAVMSLAAMATNYTAGTLVADGVTKINGTATATIASGTLTLNNVTVGSTSLGNVAVPVTSTTLSNTVAGNATMYTGSMMYNGKPLSVTAIAKADALAVVMTFELNGTTHLVTFNTTHPDGYEQGYQMRNRGFENFQSSNEPVAWHGFKSASGGYASLAPGSLTSSTDCHGGSKSAVATSGSMFGTVGNGTMTTGQLNAGATSASSTKNHSHMDASQTDTDKNGDRFFHSMVGRPDAVTVWVKFVPKSTSYKGSFSAIITNGTYYQDPEDKTYTNKLATAKNVNITSSSTSASSAVWQQLNIPFSYIDNSIEGQAILITVSTNATPGGGKSGDAIYVDDIAMVYNAGLSGISVKGSALSGFSASTREYDVDVDANYSLSASDISATLSSNSPRAYVAKSVTETDFGYRAVVAAMSNDMGKSEVYVINFRKPEVVKTPVADVVESGVEGEEYTLEESLVIADGAQLSDGSNLLFVTDGNDNWMALSVTPEQWAASIGSNAIDAATVTGIFSRTNGNPTLAVSSAPAFIQAASPAAKDYDLSLPFAPKACEVLNVKGYYRADQGNLRAYSGKYGPQGQSLTLDLGSIEFEPVDGQYIAVHGAVMLKEAWSGAPRRVAASDENAFQNYKMVVTQVQIPTGAATIEAAPEVKDVYDLQGRKINGLQKGVNIVRMTDGTVRKVVK